MRQHPQCIGVNVKGSALRCCHARLRVATRLRAALMTCRGALPSLGRTASCRLSVGSKLVNGLGWRERLEAPRYARVSRMRYIPWREKVLTLMKKLASHALRRATTKTHKTECWWANSTIGYDPNGLLSRAVMFCRASPNQEVRAPKSTARQSSATLQRVGVIKS